MRLYAAPSSGQGKENLRSRDSPDFAVAELAEVGVFADVVVDADLGAFEGGSFDDFDEGEEDYGPGDEEDDDHLPDHIMTPGLIQCNIPNRLRLLQNMMIPKLLSSHQLPITFRHPRQHAISRIPIIIAILPNSITNQTSEKVVNAISDNHVVVNAHESGIQDHHPADASKGRRYVPALYRP